MSNARHKNYYEILGLPRSATDEEISAAYRAMAIKHHPDTSHRELESGTEFKKVTEAYDVLSDPDKRRSYDRLTGGRKSHPKSNTTRVPQVSQMNLFYPVDPIRSADPVESIASQLAAFGDESWFVTTKTAPHLSAKFVESEIPVTPEEARYGTAVALTLTIRRKCWRCSGLGRSQGKNCSVCDGNCVVAEIEPISVELPAGTADGAILRFGYVSDDATRYDLQLRVRIQPSW